MTRRPDRTLGKSRLPAPNQGGFTLFELLVSVTLLAMIFAMMSGGLRFGVAAWERGEEFDQQLSEMQSAQLLVRRLVERAAPAKRVDETGAQQLLMAGAADEFVFVGGPPVLAAASGPYRIRLYFDNTSEIRNLMLGWRALQPDLSDFQDGADTGSAILARDIAAGEIAYFGSATDGEAASWRAGWLGEESGPSLVRIDLRYRAGEARRWPSLVAALRVPIRD